MTFWTQSSPHIGERTRRWVSDGYVELKNALSEVKDAIAGKRELQSAESLLDEL